MLAMFKLLLSYQKKSYFNLILCFVLPILFLFIIIAFCNTIKQPISSNGVFLALPGIIVLIGVTIGILHLSLILNDLKQTMFFKRIKAMPISIGEFFYGIFFYNLILTMLSTVLTSIIGFATYYYAINFSWVNWVIIFLVIIINSFVSCLIGFSISFLVIDYKKSLIICITLYLLILLLSGCFLPLYVIKHNLVLKIASFFLVISFITSLMVYGWYFFPPEYNGHKLITYIDYDTVDNWWIAVIVIAGVMLVLILILIYKEKIIFLLNFLKKKRVKKNEKIKI